VPSVSEFSREIGRQISALRISGAANRHGRWSGSRGRRIAQALHQKAGFFADVGRWCRPALRRVVFGGAVRLDEVLARAEQLEDAVEARRATSWIHRPGA